MKSDKHDAMDNPACRRVAFGRGAWKRKHPAQRVRWVWERLRPAAVLGWPRNGLRGAYLEVEQWERLAELASGSLGLLGVCRRKARSLLRRAGRRRAWINWYELDETR